MPLRYGGIGRSPPPPSPARQRPGQRLPATRVSTLSPRTWQTSELGTLSSAIGCSPRLSAARSAALQAWTQPPELGVQFLAMFGRIDYSRRKAADLQTTASSGGASFLPPSPQIVTPCRQKQAVADRGLRMPPALTCTYADRPLQKLVQAEGGLWRGMLHAIVMAGRIGCRKAGYEVRNLDRPLWSTRCRP